MATRAPRGRGISTAFRNVVAVVLRTVKSVERAYGLQLGVFGVFSVTVFTIEYLARIAFCVSDLRYSTPVGGRLLNV